MKKRVTLAVLALALLSGGCAVGIPISPLMLLLKNDPAPTPQIAPANLDQPSPDSTPSAPVDNNGATALS